MAGPGREAVGVVNLMRVVDESPRAQELNQMLADRYQELLTRFDLEDEPTEEDVDRSARERQAYAEYLAYRQELELQLEGEVNAAVKEVAESRGISVVLDSDVIRYGGTDLTDEVIRKLK
jgi:outer membrane protein